MRTNLAHTGIPLIRIKRRFPSKEEAKATEVNMLRLRYDTYRPAGGSVVYSKVWLDQAPLFTMEGWVLACCKEEGETDA